MKTVKTSEELGKAIKEKEDYIYIEGDLKNHVVRKKATGKLAWFIASGSLITALGIHYFITPIATATTGPMGSMASFTVSAIVATSTVTIWGIPATLVAITIAIIAGSYGVIVSLRDNYKISKRDNKGILLERK